MTDHGDFQTVTFDRLCYDYGRRRVLSRVSFEGQAGTITGLLGPNGAGKSTLLAIASTRAHPSAGTVRYGNGAAVDDQRLLRSRIGWLGHDPGFYPELTARENLLFYARLHDVPDTPSRVRAALDRAALSDRADDAVGGFSRGMRQRLGLERVLLHDPRLVLLDEPFTGLDDVSARALRDRLVDLKASGAIVLLTTHDLDFVAGLLDRAVVLRAGRVVDAFARADGETDLAERYRRAIAAPAAEPVAEATSPVQVHSAKAAAPAVEESLGAAGGRFARAIFEIARKDLIVEFRSRELFLTTLFFAVSCVLVFAFAFVREGRPLVDAAAGILWIAIAFAGTLALGRTFDREQASHTLQALLQAPIDRAAIYVGKMLGLLTLLALVEVVVVPLVSLFFQAPLGPLAWMLALLVVTGTVGFLAVGTLFSAMLVRTRSRDVLLPVLLYPMTVPVMLAGVRGTSAALQATPDEPTARMWLSMLVLFDAVFVTLALWTFDAVTSE